MSKQSKLLQDIDLRELEIAPSQVWGAIRIVPLLRRNERNDLRLTKRSYDDNLAIVATDGPMLKNKSSGDNPLSIIAPGMKYFSYVPHALVLSWSDDGSALASSGAQLTNPDGKKLKLGCASVRLLHRMAKRESKNQLRFLPLHLAMEGFLSMFFSGPDIAWSEYSKYALSNGLGFRIEYSFMGRYIQGLEDALRVFEMHPQQVGVLIFVADALASAFVLPTNADYRALHTTLIEDLYGELMYQYGCLYDTVCPIEVKLDESKIHALGDLRAELARVRTAWSEFQGFMSEGLLQRQLRSKLVAETGPFTMQRFITDLDPQQENHMGEAIISREDGCIQYLKTYRLSSAQTKRVYLLSQLADCNWNIEATADKLKCSREDLVTRFERAGFGYLLNNEVRRAALKKLN